MGSFQHSELSDNKRCTVKVTWGVFIENLTVILLLRAVVNILVQTLISQDDHLTAGAWATCGSALTIDHFRTENVFSAGKQFSYTLIACYSLVLVTRR